MDNPNSIHQVFSELSSGDERWNVAVGSRDDTHVNLAGPTVVADGLNLATLEEAKEQGLHTQAHLADLVEEDRPLVRLLELADLVAVGAGEASLYVPEELRLEKCLGERGAVDGHERPLRPRRPRVDEAGNDILANAALTRDQDLRVAA